MPPPFTGEKMSDDIKKQVLQFLDDAEIAYELFEHEPSFTIEQCAEIEKITNAPICKNLLLCPSNKSEYVLLAMQGEKPFVTKEISKRLGKSRLSFADGEMMMQLLKTAPGSLSITGLIFDKSHRVQLAVDSDLLNNEYFCCHPCDNTATLKIKTADVFEKFLPLLGVTPIITEV